MERQMLRDQFMSQQMGKNRWEGGEWGNGGFGVSHVQCVISPASIVLLLPVHACLLSHSVWSDSEISMHYSPPGSSVLFLPGGAKCQVPGFSNLTLSVVSWKHRMWFYRWNFVQYDPQKTSQHLKHCMAREGCFVAGWEQIEGLLGDQQCVRPGPPLQPQAAVFISTCQCSHINPIYFRTGMTQVSFLQTCGNNKYLQQISLLEHRRYLHGTGPNRCWAREKNLHWGTNPVFWVEIK